MAIGAHYPSDRHTYATGVCLNSGRGGINDWYLPCACVQGYNPDPAYAHVNCGSQAAPRVDNIPSRVVDNGGFGGFHLYYWSPTQGATQPQSAAWIHIFALTATGFPGPLKLQGDKAAEANVHCVRALTP